MPRKPRSNVKSKSPTRKSTRVRSPSKAPKPVIKELEIQQSTPSTAQSTPTSTQTSKLAKDINGSSPSETTKPGQTPSLETAEIEQKERPRTRQEQSKKKGEPVENNQQVLGDAQKKLQEAFVAGSSQFTSGIKHVGFGLWWVVWSALSFLAQGAAMFFSYMFGSTVAILLLAGFIYLVKDSIGDLGKEFISALTNAIQSGCQVFWNDLPSKEEMYEGIKIVTVQPALELIWGGVCQTYGRAYNPRLNECKEQLSLLDVVPQELNAVISLNNYWDCVVNHKGDGRKRSWPVDGLETTDECHQHYKLFEMTRYDFALQQQNPGIHNWFNKTGHANLAGLLSDSFIKNMKVNEMYRLQHLGKKDCVLLQPGAVSSSNSTALESALRTGVVMLKDDLPFNLSFSQLQHLRNRPSPMNVALKLDSSQLKLVTRENIQSFMFTNEEFGMLHTEQMDEKSKERAQGYLNSESNSGVALVSEWNRFDGDYERSSVFKYITGFQIVSSALDCIYTVTCWATGKQFSGVNQGCR